MKNKIMALLLIINIVLVGIIYNLLNTNGKLAGEKQILKEMSTSEREQELDNKITDLSTSATEYATYVQSCKTQIANAITERGVNTNETDTVDAMVENIKKLGSGEISVTWKNIALNINNGGVNTTKSTTFNISSMYSDYANLPSTWFSYLTSLYLYTTGARQQENFTLQNVVSTYDPTTGTLSLSWYIRYIGGNSDSAINPTISIPLIFPKK